jgi:hypothetical protein
VPRLVAVLVALMLTASPVLASICDARCAPVAPGASQYGGIGSAAAVDPHAHHHAVSSPASPDAARLADAAGCPGHGPLLLAEARLLDSPYAPALLPHPLTYAVSSRRAACPAFTGHGCSPPTPRSPLPLRI